MKLLRRRGGAAFAVGALAVAGAIIAPTAASANDHDLADDPVVFGEGHIDAFYPLPNEDGSVTLATKEDVTSFGNPRDPASIDFVVKDSAQRTLGDSSGVPEHLHGQDVYHLPLQQQSDLIWPGWETQMLNSEFGVEASTEFEFTSVEGPGEVSLWGSEASSPLVDGGHVLDEGEAISQPRPAHTHTNWAFTEPGTYEFTVRAHVVGEDENGGEKTATSEEETYRFVVDPELTIDGLADHYHPGDAIELQAAAEPGLTGGTYEWFVQHEGDDEPQPVEGQTGPELSLDAEASLNNAQITAQVTGNGGNVRPGPITTSEPVTVAVDDHSDEPEPPVTELTIEGLEDQYEVGDTANLTAVQDPQTNEDHWHWYIQREGDDDYSVIDGALTDTLEHTIAEGDGDARIIARLFDHDHEIVAESDPVTLNVAGEEEPAPEQSVEITGLSDHYHQGWDITLDAVTDPEVENGSYEWFVQRTDQDEPVQVGGQNTEQLTLTAEQALNGAQVTVNVLDADGTAIASAEPVTVTVDDHGEPAHQEVTVVGVEDHYHTGDTASLTATVDPASVLDRYQWQVQQPGSDEWANVEDVTGSEYSFDVTEDFNGAQVRASLTYNDGEVYVTSEPVTIEVDDHQDPDPQPETELSIEGLADEYQVGDVTDLTAVQDPDTGEDHWHWFIQREGDGDYSVISGASTGTLEHTIAEGDDGAQIMVRLYDHDHAVIAESEAVTLNVAADGPTDEPAEPTLGVSPEEIGITDFLDQEQGVTLSVDGLEPGTPVEFDVAPTSDQNVDPSTLPGEATEDGIASAVVYGVSEANAEDYLGDYSVKASVDDRAGESGAAEAAAEDLSGSFRVVADDDAPDGGGDDDGDNGNGDNGKDDGSGNGGDDLPRTGSEMTAAALIGAALLALGAGVVMLSRRRKLSADL